MLIGVITLIAIIVTCEIVSSVKSKHKHTLKATHLDKLIHDEKFGGIYFDGVTSDEFKKLGYDYGDSLNIKFSTGIELKDVPYYNGYYVKTGDNLFVCYKGEGFVKFCQNSGEDLFTKYIEDNSNVTISVNEKGKYKSVQEAFDLDYSSDRTKYISDEQFANFRKVDGLNIYRGASPVDNEYNRAEYVQNFCKENKINFMLNLSDNETDITDYKSKYNINYSVFDKLYNNNKVALLDMSAAYQSDIFKKKLGEGLIQMLKYKGPYYIHCVEGKDRTGFVCMLLELLMEKSYSFTKDDYMKTYENYYGITEKDTEKYFAIVDLKFNEMYYYLAELIGNANVGALIYLQQCGLSLKQIEKLKEKLGE